MKFVCIEEPHWRSTVVPQTVSGQPATIGAIRPMFQPLLADLGHAPHLHVLDLGGIEVVANSERVQDLARELVAARAGERAVAAPDRAANRVDDQRVRCHEGA